jgi:hypothetical protein
MLSRMEAFVEIKITIWRPREHFLRISVIYSFLNFPELGAILADRYRVPTRVIITD